ncbi:MAG: hypothetical protein ACOYLK_11490 [Sphingomonas sp.]
MRSIIVTMALLACSQPVEIKKVQLHEYLNISKCWEVSGKFSAFIIIHESEGQHFPFFVSYKCDLSVMGQPTGTGFTSYLKGPEFVSDGGLLKRLGMYPSPIESNAIDHLPRPVLRDVVYLFESEVASVNTEQGTINKVVRPSRMTKTGLDLGDLIRMSPAERAEVANRIRSVR